MMLYIKTYAMKNPFVKHNNNTALIASLALGTAAVGTAAYFLISNKGTSWRQQMMDRFGFGQNEVEEEPDHTAYLKKPHKSAKTDRDELLHHGTINEQPNLVN